MSDDVCAMAVALARNCGYAVFPCSDNKMPAIPKARGGKGFLDASKDADRISAMWRHFPSPLIGVATGAASGISVLDIDVKHKEAVKWWRDNARKIPDTRVYRTRSGGFHVLFEHVDGVRNSQSNLALGVDTRGDGGYIVFWFAAGFECINKANPIPWPAWLTAACWPPRIEQKTADPQRSQAHTEASIRGLIRVVREAREGERNGKLNWAAFKMREHIDRALITKSQAKQDLAAAAMAAGLHTKEIILTLTSALGA